MKKIYLTLLILISISMVFLALASVRAQDLDISFQQNPFPMQAGSQGALTFTITNNQNSNLTIDFNLDVNDPVVLNSAADQTVFIRAGETKSIVYNVYIQGDTSKRSEGVTLNYDLNGEQSEDFDVIIAPQQVFLQISSVSSNPEQVAPGGNVSLNLGLENTADVDIQNVIVSLDLNSAPFAPDSVSEQSIDLIEHGDTSSVRFSLIALPSAGIGVYKIPVTLTYNDEYGRSYERTDTVSINVFEQPSINVVVDKDSLILDVPSNISLKVLNKGVGGITFSELTILPSSDYEIINGYDYIGSVASDDYSSVDFRINPKKQNVTLYLELDYRDANNQKYSETETVNVQAYTVPEAQSMGILPSFPWLVVIIILVIIALIIFFIVRGNRKKKKLMSSKS